MEPILNDSDLPDSELTNLDLLNRYKMEIQLYDKDYKPWETRSTKIIKRYKDERAATQTNPTRFNILYSNVQTLFPAAYGHDPKPDIQRRFKDDDVLGRVTSDVLERCTDFQVNSKFSDAVKHALQDRLLPGRGVTWARYEPHFRDAQFKATDGQITDNIYPESEEEPTQEVYYEEVCHDYVHWKDFGHNVARVWDEVYCGWRKVYLTKDELTDRFGKEIADKCPMDYSPRGLNDEKQNEVMKKSTIYELWDKSREKVNWIHKDLDQFLDIKDDPLELPEFFPFPKPLFGIITNDSLIPVPDFVEYQDQAAELDELTSRIAQITKAIKVVGVYDASAAGVERMLNEGVENKLIAVESWAVFGEKGGLKGAMELMPVKELADTLLALYDARERVKNDLYEITGIADIIRGATKASETATAQNIKSQFATLRLDVIQHSVARFARDMVVNTALIIAKHFSLDTIKAISGVQLMTAQEKQQFQMQQQQAQLSGQQPPPIDDKMQEMLDNPTWEEVHALLQDLPHLNFKIDIETDSTIKMDEQQDQEARLKFLEAAGGFIQQAAQIQNPELIPLLVQMLLFGVRGFKVGKSIEGTFRTILAKVEKQAQQPQPPKPDPEMEKIKADQAANMARIDADKQADAAKVQADKEKASAQLIADAQKAKLDATVDLMKHEKTLASQKDIAAMSNEANSKPTTTVSLSADDAVGQIAQTLQKMGEHLVQTQADTQQSLQETMQGITKAQGETSYMLSELARTLHSPKEITLDNGRKATVKPTLN